MEDTARKFQEKEIIVLSVALEHCENNQKNLVKMYEKRGFCKSHTTYQYTGVNNDALTTCVAIGESLPVGKAFSETGYLMSKEINL